MNMFCLVYVYECFTYMNVCVPHMCLVPSEVRRGVRSPGTEVRDDCRCWGLNPEPLQEQPVLLPTPATSCCSVTVQLLPPSSVIPILGYFAHILALFP